MRTILLDESKFGSEEEVHSFLKEALEFPDFYGNNLDALYDVLTDIQEKTRILLFMMDREKGFGVLRRFDSVFQDASEENACLEILRQASGVNADRITDISHDSKGR